MTGTRPSVPPVVYGPDQQFDTLAALTRRLLDVPTAYVSMVTATEHLIPGAAGRPSPWDGDRVVPLSHSFCQHVVNRDAPLVVADSRAEPLLEGNASADAGVIAYAGMPLVDLDGATVGSLCVFDDDTREWTDDELTTLSELAAVCSAELQRREALRRAAVAGERDRIAHDLNASVLSELLALSMTLGGLRSLSHGEAAAMSDRALETVDRVLKKIRGTVFESPDS